MKLQESRIKILERRNYKQIINDQNEYTLGMSEHEKKALLNAITY